MAAMMIVTAGFAQAQQYAFANLSGDSIGGVQPSRFQVGELGGREGAALGVATVGQVNFGYFGVYGIAGHSSLNGYQQQGATANFGDNLFGGGVVVRLIGVHRFTFGGFTQFGRYTSAVVATAPDGAGGIFQYRDNETNFIATLGADVEYQVPRVGLSLFVRPGHTFGNSVAATTANGLSLTFGTLIGVEKIGNGLRRVTRLLP